MKYLKFVVFIVIIMAAVYFLIDWKCKLAMDVNVIGSKIYEINMERPGYRNIMLCYKVDDFGDIEKQCLASGLSLAASNSGATRFEYEKYERGNLIIKTVDVCAFEIKNESDIKEILKEGFAGPSKITPMIGDKYVWVNQYNHHWLNAMARKIFYQ